MRVRASTPIRDQGEDRDPCAGVLPGTAARSLPAQPSSRRTCASDPSLAVLATRPATARPPGPRANSGSHRHRTAIGALWVTPLRGPGSLSDQWGAPTSERSACVPGAPWGRCQFGAHPLHPKASADPSQTPRLASHRHGGSADSQHSAFAEQPQAPRSDRCRARRGVNATRARAQHGAILRHPGRRRATSPSPGEAYRTPRRYAGSMVAVRPHDSSASR